MVVCKLVHNLGKERHGTLFPCKQWSSGWLASCYVCCQILYVSACWCCALEGVIALLSFLRGTIIGSFSASQSNIMEQCGMVCSYGLISLFIGSNPILIESNPSVTYILYTWMILYRNISYMQLHIMTIYIYIYGAALATTPPHHQWVWVYCILWFFWSPPPVACGGPPPCGLFWWYVSIFLSIYLSMYVCMYVSKYVCMYVWYVCMVCMYVCM